MSDDPTRNGSDSVSSNRRRFIQLTGGVGLAGLAGCVSTGGDDTDTPADDDGSDDGSSDDGSNGGAETTDEPTDAPMANSLKIWSLGTQPAGLEAVGEQYNDEMGSDVSFDISELGYNELHDQQAAAVAAGSGGPDIGAYEGRWAPDLIGTGGLADFADHVDQEIRDTMVEWSWDMLSDDEGNGVYGLPIDIAPTVTFYNRDLYDQAGISPSDIETYEDFISAQEDMPDGVNMMGVGTGVLEWRWEMLLRQQDGEAYTEDGALMIDTPETRTAAETIKRLFDTGTAVDVEEFTESWVTGLQEGQIATVTSGAWMAGALEGTVPDMAGQWGIHRPPAVTSGGGRASNHGGSNLIVPAHKDQETINRAWDFMEYALTNEEQALTIAKEAGIFPANKDIYDDEWWEQEQDFFGGDSFKVIVDVAEEIPTMRMITDHREVYDRMGDFFASYVDGEYDSAAAMAQDAEETIAGELGRNVA